MSINKCTGIWATILYINNQGFNTLMMVGNGRRGVGGIVTSWGSIMSSWGSIGGHMSWGSIVSNWSNRLDHSWGSIVSDSWSGIVSNGSNSLYNSRSSIVSHWSWGSIGGKLRRLLTRYRNESKCCTIAGRGPNLLDSAQNTEWAGQGANYSYLYESVEAKASLSFLVLPLRWSLNSLDRVLHSIFSTSFFVFTFFCFFVFVCIVGLDYCCCWKRQMIIMMMMKLRRVHTLVYTRKLAPSIYRCVCT